MAEPAANGSVCLAVVLRDCALETADHELKLGVKINLISLRV